MRPAEAPLVDGRDPQNEQLYAGTIELPRELVERMQSAFDVGQSIITDDRWKREQDELRAELREILQRTRTVTVPVTLFIKDVDGASQIAGHVNVLAVPDAEPQGLAWDVRARLVYNIGGPFGNVEFTDGEVSEWEA